MTLELAGSSVLQRVLLHALPVALRVGSALSFAPFLGSLSIPVRSKAVLTVLLTAILYPFCRVPELPLSPLLWTRVALSEITLGLAMGLALQFVLEAAQLAGQITSFQLAFSLVNVIDPQTNVDTPVLSIFHQLMALLFLLLFNVHHWILRGLARSFDYVPVGSVVITPASARALFHAASGMWLAGVQMAVPLLLVTLLIDLTVGFLSKASPQMPALILSVPLKSAAGYLALALVVAAWPGIFEKQYALALSWSERLLRFAQ
ncbi:MAG TPA: flagellar biosynthetic protein FliR [Dongiaceae bacterium]|nr:flagellar biosynthetic protein FliR [Dongiaceae bacterium]